jgi:BCD family chlorophyll transporter-like MFS transporter
MNALKSASIQALKTLGPAFLPFADAATPELPMGRLLRLSLFQVTVGMAAVLLIGTLNRVMIVELGVKAWLVAVMVSLPLLFAPARAIIGHRSDTYRSFLGWRRVPFIWFGTMLQFGGLAIMPFALILLSGDTTGPWWIGHVGAALAFLLVGAGLHTVQTIGLALATDIAPAQARPKVVALLCVMLLVGMMVSAVVYGALLANFSQLRLIQVIQGSAVLTIVINLVALWKQEARNPDRTRPDVKHEDFRTAWRGFLAGGKASRRLVATGIGTVAFSMQDILLEPYGGQILKLSVGSTTALTGALATGGVVGLILAARRLGRGADPHRVAALGVLAGIFAFSAVIFAGLLQMGWLFAAGVTMIGFGAGLFGHGTLTATMASARDGSDAGLALGAWGAVQATAAGLAIATGGILRDGVASWASTGALGEVMAEPASSYTFVYHLEILLLFATLVALGPLVARRVRSGSGHSSSQTQLGRLAVSN